MVRPSHRSCHLTRYACKLISDSHSGLALACAVIICESLSMWWMKGLHSTVNNVRKSAFYWRKCSREVNKNRVKYTKVFIENGSTISPTFRQEFLCHVLEYYMCMLEESFSEYHMPRKSFTRNIYESEQRVCRTNLIALSSHPWDYSF